MSDARKSGGAGDYRRDIDGLRAIAIAAVLLFHFDLLGAEGGFVGVDVFFVISGYLMTAMLARHGASAGSFGDFYRRRFWRIAPAYVFTLAATLAAGFFWLLPVDLERLGASAIASAFFVSNFFFASGAGYFDTASIYKPLLHTWSLAVEAQFYLVWPFVMMGVLWLRPSRRLAAVLAIFAASFIACFVLAIADPKVAFFSLPARLWQFALGALVAIDARVANGLRGRSFAPALQWFSLAAIVATPWLVREGDAWPAPWALPACLGTAGLIALGGGHACGWLLESKPLAFLGRISYSLYLVHWPVVVFVFYAQFPQAPAWLRLASLAACLPLAMLLYRTVETPLRRHGRAARGAGRSLAALACVVLATIGVGIRAQIAPPRAPDAQLDAFACTVWRAPSTGVEFCKIGDPQAEPDALLWGDSHAMQFAQGYALRLARDGGAVLIAVRDACPPASGLWRVANLLTRREDCPRGNSQALAMALAETRITTIILAARWAFYVETTRFGAEKGGRAFVVSEAERDLSIATTRRVLEERLDAGLGALSEAKKRVVIIAQVPELGFDAARCSLMRGRENNSTAGCDISRAAVDARQANATAMLARLAARHDGVRLVDPRDALCDAELCHGARGGLPSYRDDNHLTARAAARVLDALLGAPR